MSNDLLELKFRTIRYLTEEYEELAPTLGAELMSLPTQEDLFNFYLHYAHVSATAPVPDHIKAGMANFFIDQALTLVSCEAEHDKVYLTKANTYSLINRRDEAYDLFLQLRHCGTQRMRVAANIGLCNRAIESGDLLELKLCLADIENDLTPDTEIPDLPFLTVVSMADQLPTPIYVRLLKALQAPEVRSTPEFWEAPIFDLHRDAPEFQQLMQVS